MAPLFEAFLDFIESLKTIVGSVNNVTQALDIQAQQNQLHSEHVEWLVIHDKDSRLGWDVLCTQQRIFTSTLIICFSLVLPLLLPFVFVLICIVLSMLIILLLVFFNFEANAIVRGLGIIRFL